MNPDPEMNFRPSVHPPKAEPADGVAGAVALENIALAVLRDPSLTPEERDILEKAVRVARSRQKRVPPS